MERYLYWLGGHDDVIKWKHFARYWPFVRRIHRSPVNSPHKGQWRGALMFSLICVWINCWVNNREAGYLRRYRTHYDVIVMDLCLLLHDTYSLPAGLSFEQWYTNCWYFVNQSDTKTWGTINNSSAAWIGVDDWPRQYRIVQDALMSFYCLIIRILYDTLSDVGDDVEEHCQKALLLTWSNLYLGMDKESHS